MDGSENTEGEEEIDQQCQVDHQTGEETVDEAHVDHQQHEGYEERDHSCLDSCSTERRAHHILLHDTHGGCHLTRLKGVGKVGCFIDGEVTGDLRGTIGDLIEDIRCRVDHIIEYNSDGSTDILLRQTCPLLGTLRIHGHGDTRILTTLLLIDLTLGTGDYITGECRLIATARALESIQLEDITPLAQLLGAPAEDKVTRQHISHLRQAQHRINGGTVSLTSHSDHGSRTTARELETREQRIILGCCLRHGSLSHSGRISTGSYLLSQSLGSTLGTVGGGLNSLGNLLGGLLSRLAHLSRGSAVGGGVETSQHLISGDKIVAYL